MEFLDSATLCPSALGGLTGDVAEGVAEAMPLRFQPPPTLVVGGMPHAPTSSAPPRPVVVVKPATSLEDRRRSMTIREEVFVVEQGVPPDLELDDDEERCQHFLALVGDDVVGTARLNPISADVAKAQRVAVLAPWRGSGVGAALMASMATAAREAGHKRVELGSQLSAIPFYERLGYVADGPIFDDAGIPHRHMSLALEGEE